MNSLARNSTLFRFWSELRQDILEQCCDFIDNAKATNSAVLLHCSQGVNRSATIAIAYLMTRYETHVRRIVANVTDAGQHV